MNYFSLLTYDCYSCDSCLVSFLIMLFIYIIFYSFFFLLLYLLFKFFLCLFFFFKQKTAFGMRISDWSSDVCSSDLTRTPSPARWRPGRSPGRASTSSSRSRRSIPSFCASTTWCCCRTWARPPSRAASPWARRSSSRSKPSSTATRRPTASWRQCSKSLHRARPLGRGIVNGDFAADDGVLGGLGRFLHRRRDERLIVPVQHPVEPALGEAQHRDAWFPSALALRREVVVDGDVDALPHGGQHVPGMQAILVRIRSDAQHLGVGCGLQHADAGAAGRLDDDIGDRKSTRLNSSH